MDFEQIYKSYFKDVFLYLRSLSASEDMAEEITQETFVKALKAIDTFDGSKNIRAWLFTIAKNTYYTYCKRKKMYAYEELPDNAGNPGASFEENFVDEERAFLIHRFLHNMKEPYKEVFNLRVFGELPFEKIGLLFGKSSGWARVTDVLPLYLDDVVSEDTKNMVEEHLKSCESCRKEAVLLNEDMILPLGSGAQDAEIKTLKYLKKQFRNKKAVVSAVSVFLAFIIMLGTYALLVTPKLFIPYDSTCIKVEKIDEKLYARYIGSNLEGSVARNSFPLEKDGEKKDVTFFYIYKSPWSELRALLQKDTEDHLIFLGNADEIDEVYYGKFRIERPEELSADLEESELIWKK